MPLLLPMLMLKLMLTLFPGFMAPAADTVMVDTDVDTDTADTAVVVTTARDLLIPNLRLMLPLMLGVMDMVVDTDTADTDVDTEDMADTDTTVARGPLNLMLNPIPGVTTVAHMDTVTAIAMAAGDTVDMATTDKCHLSSKV